MSLIRVPASRGPSRYSSRLQSVTLVRVGDDGGLDGFVSAAGSEPNLMHIADRASVKSPHRMGSWLLAGSVFTALALAALAWSMAMDGRWTILSCTAVLTTFLVLFANGYFRVNMADGGSAKARLAVAASAIGVTAALVVVSVPALGQPGVPGFVALMVVLLVAATTARAVGRRVLTWLWGRGHLRARALILGYDELARELALEISMRRSYGVDIVGYLIPPSGYSGPLPPGRTVETLVDPLQPLPASLTRALAAIGADRLIVGPATGTDDQLAQAIARWAAQQGMAVHVVPRFYGMGLGLDSMSPDRARGYPLVRLQRSAHPQLSVRLKRLLDIVVSATLLVVAAPAMAVAAVAVRLSGPGPILFAQERVGQHGRPIIVRKFRSMTMSATSDTEWCAEGRITKVGTWLRRSNLDELPQLFSVLSGAMSLVGPRPERPSFVRDFERQIPGYGDRHRMPVGLTGLAQVVGLRGDTSIAERVKYDNLYIDQWCLRSDIGILLRTITAILFQEADSRRVTELESAIEDMRSRTAVRRPAEIVPLDVSRSRHHPIRSAGSLAGANPAPNG